MFPSFSARAISLRELLSGASSLVTPGFQRPYSWTLDEVAQLLDDLLEALEDAELSPPRAGVFFLGTIILVDSSGAQKGGRKVLEIIDGQQRLVTLTMLLAILRDLARAEGDPDHADALHERIASESGCRVSIHESENAFLRDHVQEADAFLTDIDPVDLESPEKDIILNRNHLISELRALDRATRRRLAACLEERCILNVVMTDDVDSAYRIFMVVNGLSKPLLRSDILKAELLSAVPSARRDGYVARWNAVERKVGLAAFESLFSYLRAALGDPRAKIIAEVRRLAQTEPGAQFLDNSVFPMAEALAAMLGREPSGLDLPAKGVRLLKYLGWLNHSDWLPAALLWLQRNRSDAAALLAYLEAADRFAYGQLFLGIGHDKRVNRYGNVLELIRQGKSPLTDKGPLSLSADDQRNIMYNTANDVYGRNSATCKLLLLRLNDTVTGKAAGIAPSEVSVEHVLPLRPARTSQWRTSFPDGVREYYTGSLGNLILVRAPTNSDVRNYELDRKLRRFREDDVLARLPLFSEVLGLDRWTPDVIQAREDRLIEALRQLWRLAGPTGRRRPPGR